MNFLGCCGSLNVGSVLAWLLDQGLLIVFAPVMVLDLE
jgi:hypothetical protein